MTSPASDRRGALAIHTTDLGKRFGDRTALAGVDLEVPRGTAFGFLGANGAGKTTLIRLLLGLAQPTSGHMRVLGHDLPGERAAALARVGAIIEEPRFHPAPHRPREPPHPRGRPRPRRPRPHRRRAGARRARPRVRDDRVKALLARHAPAPRRRALPADRSRAADPRRAAQRARSRRHPRVPRPHPRARRRGPHRAALLAPARRGREDLRRRGDRRRRPRRRTGHDPRARPRRPARHRHRLRRPRRGRSSCWPRCPASAAPPITTAACA